MVVPTSTNPNRFRIRAVTITEAFAVVIIEGELAAGAWIDLQGRWFAHRLGNVLTYRIKRNDRGGLQLKLSPWSFPGKRQKLVERAGSVRGRRDSGGAKMWICMTAG